MSSLQTDQLVDEYSSAVTGNYVFIAGAVLFLYDLVITTDDEIRYFWGRKITGAALLFWLNKYMTTLYLIWDLGSIFKISNESCAVTIKGDAAVDFLLFLVLAAFTGIRVYALRRSLLLSSTTFLLATVPVGVNFANFSFGLTGENLPLFGCAEAIGTPVDVTKMLTIVARSCLIAADCIAVAATWFTLSRRHRNLRQGNSLRGSISSVLLVDGTIYFLTLAILNALHLTFTMLSLGVAALESTSYITAFTTPLSAVLVSRFLLHLQSANLRAVGMASSQALTASRDSTIVFDRVVGSLGASVVLDDYHGQEGDWEDSDDVAERSDHTHGGDGGGQRLE
ncbi:hypothetical protein BD311DRAFT_683366 [Dichomitus squalens]|uniref:DUF6533 domain-containing protein n=1 Tax=Dichomitus squalens TaxID=114155 RepID=A0A4V2K1U2_9APHY|nr:hypothetical protein BD311DRAFT_683366 [Dichomitus squalens]